MRAFIGIALPPALQESVAELQRELAVDGADVKWVAPHQLHATLKFLGEIDEQGRARAETALRLAAAKQGAFTMRLELVGAFPSTDSPQVVWVGVGEGKEALMKLAQVLDRELEAAGWPAEMRPFAPHLTIGRVRSAYGLRGLAQRLRALDWSPPQASWPASSVTFYQSVLSAEGPRYTVLADVPLGSIAG